VNYWTWPADYGDDVSGTETLVQALSPGILRVGGYNNDTNQPNPFDAAAFGKATAYAHAIGAEPLIQVPIIDDGTGHRPTAATTAAMVQQSVTQGYGVKYFSIGNEPDIDADQGYIAGYAPTDYCADARAFATAMKAVDPGIQIVGPDLAYKYQGAADWLTPVLTACGDVFDIVSIHRYPYDSAHATLANAAGDTQALQQVLGTVRGILQGAGFASKPLALTETNFVYNPTPPGMRLTASPGSVPAGLWLADTLGTAVAEGLWTTAVWDISDTDGSGGTLDESLGLVGVPPQHTPRPAYYAMELAATHLGPTLLEPGSAPAGIRVYASRNAATEILVVNWNQTPQTLSLAVNGAGSLPAAAQATFCPLTVSALEIPDHGSASGSTYGQTQFAAGSGPAALAVTEEPNDGGVELEAGAETSAATFDYTFDTPGDAQGFVLDTFSPTPPFNASNPENLGAHRAEATREERSRSPPPSRISTRSRSRS
jgi:hypothetical protein